MTLTDAEQRFLARQPRGHLATIGPDGTPQVKPLGFTYNTALGTIDIAGYNMGGSAKYRNIQANPRVAFVVDEVTEASMEGTHFLEIRGAAEAVLSPATADGHLAAEIIRIHPRRVIGWNVDPDRLGLQTRDVTAGGSAGGSGGGSGGDAAGDAAQPNVA
jgi:pyridoxamine 5'-phosphate oxidase family protein